MPQPLTGAVLSLLLLAASSAAQPADLIVENARIWSDGLDGFAEFLAVRDGRIISVGEPNPKVIGPETERVDAKGRVVIPGLIDSHVHMLSGGLALGELQLREATSKADFVRRVREWSAGLGGDEWVLGGRWSVESWDEPQQPTREWIDEATGGRPAFLPRMDGHSALANSAALAIAGITADGPADPEGGVIDRDPETGEPTGILRESAMGLVARHIPRDSNDTKVQALRRAMRHANALGVTAVCDIPDWSDMRAYDMLAHEGTSVRFYLYPTASDWEQAARESTRMHSHRGVVEHKGFKVYLDGSLGSRTAYMAEPFLDNPDPHPHDWRGLLREGIEDGTFELRVSMAREYGKQVIAHAIGDQANSLLLDTLDRVYGPDLVDARCRSEHAQHLLPEDIERFAALGVIASMQPYHKADDGRYAEEYIGEERSRSSYAFRSLLSAGALVCFGSDWPVVSMSPWLGIDAAVNSRTLTGEVWQPQEAISVEEALRCYTSRAAYAAFAEREIGRIAFRMRADFVILDRSPFEEGVDLASVKPLAVYVGGERVYAAKNAD